MTDVFEEVEEQLRSERYSEWARKGWPYLAAIAVAALVAFGGYWGWQAWQQSRSAKAADQYAAASEAFVAGDTDKGVEQFEALSKSGPKTYRALALMQIAGIRTEANQDEEALKLLDQAADVAGDPLIEDAARLKAAYLVFDTASLEDLRKRLDPLTEAGRPFSALAREAVAMKLLAAGQLDEARTSFSVLTLLPDATDDLRQRAQAAVALIDSGSAKVVPQLVAAAKALPPPQAPAPAAVGAATPAPGAPPAADPAANSAGDAQ